MASGAPGTGLRSWVDLAGPHGRGGCGTPDPVQFPLEQLLPRGPALVAPECGNRWLVSRRDRLLARDDAAPTARDVRDPARKHDRPSRESGLVVLQLSGWLLHGAPAVRRSRVVRRSLQ